MVLLCCASEVAAVSRRVGGSLTQHAPDAGLPPVWCCVNSLHKWPTGMLAFDSDDIAMHTLLVDRGKINVLKWLCMGGM